MNRRQETKYWLGLLNDTGYIDRKSLDSIYADVDEAAAILFTILKTTKRVKQLTMNREQFVNCSLSIDH